MGLWLSKLLPAGTVLLVGILTARVSVRVVLAALRRIRLEESAYKLLASVLRWGIYVLIGLAAASRLGVDVTGIVALASVLTLAVSLSLQNALTNVIGGFAILYTKPFVPGDFVEIADRSGTVREVGLTYTKLTTPDNKTVSIPNSTVVVAQVVNYSAAGTRRVDISVFIAYDTPVDQVLEALREAGAVSYAVQAPFAAAERYGDGGIHYVLQIWCASEDYWKTLFEANRRVKEVFDRRGLEITPPRIFVKRDE